MPGSGHLAREPLPGTEQLVPRTKLLEKLVGSRALPQLARVLALAAVSIGGPPRGRQGF
jgi:hypothetical protein